MPYFIFRKTVFALGLICGLCRGEQSAPDSSTYAFFFEKVTQVRDDAVSVGILNGRETEFIQPSIQQEIGLTSGEAEILRKIAVACVAKMRALNAAAQPSTFEARLRLLDTAEPIEEKVRVRQRLDDIENRRDQIVRSCLDELRSGLGEPRFEVVQSYVASVKDRAFFLLVQKKPPAPPRPQPKKDAVE